jgi:hypothetical protein
LEWPTIEEMKRNHNAQFGVDAKHETSGEFQIAIWGQAVFGEMRADWHTDVR